MDPEVERIIREAQEDDGGGVIAVIFVVVITELVLAAIWYMRHSA